MKQRIAPLFALFIVLLSGCKNSNSTTDYHDDLPNSGNAKIDIYATNDIHGQVLEDSNNAGLLKYGTYLNEKGMTANTLLIDQGDTWHGSIYSNSNHGALITDVMNYIRYDARTIGNHDFDWGMDYIKQNTNRDYEGYKTPVLGGNIYDFDFANKTVGTTQQSDLGIKSVTYTLENGLKVGILGCIGSNQITDISSNFTKTITFTDHVKFIKEEATYLKESEKCHVIIASIHGGQEDVVNKNLGQYVDLVLCGHTHRQENTHEGSLYFVQSKAYAQSLSHITLNFDFSKRDVTATGIQYIKGSDINKSVKMVNPTIQNIYNNYVPECEITANEVLANNVKGEFDRYSSATNIMAKAIFDESQKEGHDVCLSLLNESRKNLPTGTWKYSDLYQSFPFDNTIFIADITGRELLTQVNNENYIYRNPTFVDDDIDPNLTYKVAVLDYIYFHTDANRDYDYFPTTAGTSTIKLEKNYRELLKDWLKEKGFSSGIELNPNDYSSSLWQHNVNLFH